MTKLTNQSTASDDIGVSRPIFVGLIIIAVFFGGIMGWAALAPLGSAAIASGVISVEGSRKSIQHLEGGIVDKILVKDGDFVEEGQVLLTLEETQAQASIKLIYGRKMVALAEMARLIAERDGASTLTFSDWLLERQSDVNVSKSMEGQLNIFAARRLSRESQITILEQKGAQLEEEIKGLKGQTDATDRQLFLIKEELADVAQLVKKKLAKRTRLRSLQRDAAELSGQRSQSISKVAESKQAIGEIKLQISELGNAVLNEVVNEIKNVQAQLFDLEEQEHAALDVLNRIKVTAPNSGVIVNLQIFTEGGVIRSGDTLMDIVPLDQTLLIDAEVSTADIDVVKLGAKAQIRFPAFSQRTSQPINGTVISVSADSLLNERSGTFYYQTLVRIDSLEGSNLTISQLRPGMQADVMIATGERTALDYFLNPVLQSFNRAMTEQ